MKQPLLSLPQRLRRNRKSEAVRSLVRETHLHASNLIAPFFLIEGTQQRTPILSMPGIERLTIDLLIREAARLHEEGIQAIALFPAIPPEQKDDMASEALNASGLVPNAIRALKRAIPSLCVIADVALDPYTSHGHDGIADEKGEILNDVTVERLVAMSLILADAGVDFVAPSDMMDGRVKAIRSALDEMGHIHTGIFSYCVKYATTLYGPFRDAVGSQLRFGDKKTYQMDPSNAREALLEAAQDEEEGADILLIKPALFYLDIISRLRNETLRPIAAYHVSGEYAMVMAAHEKGYLDADRVFYEALLSIKRAGADLIFTYAAARILPML